MGSTETIPLITIACTDKMCYSTFCSKDQIYMQRYHGPHLEEEEGPLIMAVAAAAAAAFNILSKLGGISATRARGEPSAPDNLKKFFKKV